MLMLLLCAGVSGAGAFGADDAPAAGTAQEGSMSAAPDRFLVLNNGRVIRGKLTPRIDGYEVQLPNGRLFIDSEQIRFPADTMADAYRKMQKARLELTPKTHIELAQWCIANQMIPEARRELLDALHLDPERSDAKRLLQKVVKQTDRQSASGIDGNEIISGDAGAQQTEVKHSPVVEARSLAGFSAPVAERFVRQVQRVLVSKCSGGGCHSGNHGDFQLQAMRNGSTPLIAERNLAAVIRHIDVQAPESSPLLTALSGNHGGLKTPVLRGQAGRVQAEMLREWVLSAATDLNPELKESRRQNPPELKSAVVPPEPVIVRASGRDVSHISEASPETQSSEIVPVSGISTSSDETELADTGLIRKQKATAVDHQATVSTDDSDQMVLKEIATMNRRDAFDPELFNQKYHSQHRDTVDPNSRKESR